MQQRKHLLVRKAPLTVSLSPKRSKKKQRAPSTETSLPKGHPAAAPLPMSALNESFPPLDVIQIRCATCIHFHADSNLRIGGVTLGECWRYPVDADVRTAVGVPRRPKANYRCGEWTDRWVFADGRKA